VLLLDLHFVQQVRAFVNHLGVVAIRLAVIVVDSIVIAVVVVVGESRRVVSTKARTRLLQVPFSSSCRVSKNSPIGDLLQHALRHDDSILQLLEHQIVVAGAGGRLVGRPQSLMELHHRVGGLHQLIDDV